MSGRVVFPGGSSTPVESNVILVVELQDISLADAPAKLIAQTTSTASLFPMSFAIKYTSKQAGSGISYSLTAIIRNQNGDLLYINEVSVDVIPVGSSRTTSIDVPVICVKGK